jgi:hypothetical protein
MGDLLRTTAKKVIPASFVRGVRGLRRDWAIRKSLQPLRRKASMSPLELSTFRSAWGNEGFSGDTRYLIEAIDLLREARGTVVECGSGATTILAGVLAERFRFHVVCLEQSPEWAAHVGRTLVREQLHRVAVLETPLVEYDGFAWYDLRHVDVPDPIDLIICDGPFIDDSWPESVRSSWRYGVLPFAWDRGVPTILLDDYDDELAPAVLARWRREFGVRSQIVSDDSGDCVRIWQPEFRTRDGSTGAT